jgi:tetratricopeptide (TPR) repeat protein
MMRALRDQVMNDFSSTQTRRDAEEQRLRRLESFLIRDPTNGALRADAFMTAMRCSAWASAQRHLDAARVAQPHDVAWMLRECDLLLAQGRYEPAREVIRSLSANAAQNPDLSRVLAYNAAFIEFSEGHDGRCIEQMRSLIATEGGNPLFQQLWIRALHRAGESEEACVWATAAEDAGVLHPLAAGASALVAIDEGNFEKAVRWCELAERSSEPPSIELLVAQATLAMAGRDTPRALRLTEEALRRNGEDGRTWSVRAFADLLSGDLTQAAEDFDRAVQRMPTHIGTWQGRGWTSVLQGDLQKARASFDAALALDHNFGESHGGMAVVLAMLGERTAATHHLSVADRLDPGNLSSRYAEALLNGEAADVAAMARLAERLLRVRSGPFGGTMADWLPSQKAESR